MTLSSASIIFISLIFLTYSNTFQADWHYDDMPNILENPHLHIKNLKPHSLFRTFFAGYAGGKYDDSRLYRPLACMTFALNWYIGKNEVVGYHIVNILIHCISACVLFLVIRQLFKTPVLIVTGQRKEAVYSIALLAVAFWAANPIQTQAVTYVVQRMASLAAMFYTIGIYCFLKGRMSYKFQTRIILYCCCILSYILALGSKENAITLPITLLLIEILFFQRAINFQRAKRIHIYLLFAAVAAVGLSAIFYLSGGQDVFGTYRIRPFGLKERLLTESRIIIFYISQIFYPIPNRLSIKHDIVLSTSLFHPFSTFLAVATILGLIVLSIAVSRKHPVFSFSILFYFLTHCVESTILPLELIFEHRNYLPSLFLFLPIAIGMERLLVYYKNKSKLIFLSLSILIIGLICGFGVGTYSRNVSWKTEMSLWEDAIRKAPASAVPYQNLAVQYYKNIGDHEAALFLLQKAVPLKGPKLFKSKALTLKHIGNIYYWKHDYETAISFYREALAIYSDYHEARYNLVLALMQTKRFETALAQSNVLLESRKNSKYLLIKGLSLLNKGKIESSINCFQKVIKEKPDNIKGHLYIGGALNLLGRYSMAEKYLEKIRTICPECIYNYFYLIENRIKAEDMLSASIYTDELLSLFPIPFIQSKLKMISASPFLPPIAEGIVTQYIITSLRRQNRQLNRKNYDTVD